jgi:hypothetical protein
MPGGVPFKILDMPRVDRITTLCLLCKILNIFCVCCVMYGA